MVLIMPNADSQLIRLQSRIFLNLKLLFRKVNLTWKSKYYIRLIPNYIGKSKNARETYVGNELNSCKDFSGLFYNLAFHKVIFIKNLNRFCVYNKN